MRNDLKSFAIIIALACLAWSSVTNAYAQSSSPCVDDVKRLCPEVKPGEGRLVECLKQHEQELSAPCKKSIEELKQRLRETGEACADDVSRFCGDVTPGKGRVARCLRRHAAELSPECKAKLEEMRQDSRRRPQEKAQN